MKLSQSRTRTLFPISFKKIWKKTLVDILVLSLILPLSYVFVLNFGLGIFGLYRFFTPILTLGLLILPIIYILTFFYERWYFATYYYEITDDYLIIKKGTFAPSEITIPLGKIQDVYMDQDVIDRIAGLYDVHVSSATFSSSISAHIDGLEKVAADGLRNELLHKLVQKPTTSGSITK